MLFAALLLTAALPHQSAPPVPTPVGIWVMDMADHGLSLSDDTFHFTEYLKDGSWLSVNYNNFPKTELYQVTRGTWTYKNQILVAKSLVHERVVTRGDSKGFRDEKVRDHTFNLTKLTSTSMEWGLPNANNGSTKMWRVKKIDKLPEPLDLKVIASVKLPEKFD